MFFIANAAFASNIAVVVSARLTPYIDALEGIKSTVSAFDLYYMDDNPKYIESKLKDGRYQTVLSIGSQANALVADIKNRSFKNVSSFMVYPNFLRENRNYVSCGTYLQVGAESLVKNIKSKLSGIKSIGVIYSSEESRNYVEDLSAAADKYSLSIYPMNFYKSKDIFRSSSPLWDNFDLLLFIPDNVLSSESLIDTLIKNAVIKGKKIAGYNSYFCENGANICFIVDYKKTGTTIGWQLNTLIKNGECKSSEPVYNIRLMDRK